jgi:transcriptional regulator with XRE-family HTH domain
MDLQAIGYRIRAARQSRGLTQSALAALVGVTRSAVAQWETGRSGQVGSNLALVADALNVDVGRLLLGNVAAPGAQEAPLSLTGNERALLTLYRDCSPADQAVLLRIAHQLGKTETSNK